METIKNILFTTDFSENAENALPYALDFVKKNNGKLNLLHVYDAPIMAPANAFTTHTDAMNDLTNDIRLIATNKLKKIISDHGLSDSPHRCFIREGNIEDEIIEIVEKESIDLVVMGTKGEKAEKGLFMGSITKEVLQHSPCPVLAVPESTKFGDIKKIVYATNLQYDEKNIVNYIVEFAKLYDATIDVLHIDQDNKIKEWSIDLLIDIIEKTDYPNIGYMEKIVENTADGISDYLENQKPDIIAMTTYSTNIFDAIFHKSLTKEILFHTKIPLLAFHRKKYSTVFLG